MSSSNPTLHDLIRLELGYLREQYRNKCESIAVVEDAINLMAGYELEATQEINVRNFLEAEKNSIAEKIFGLEAQLENVDESLGEDST